MQQSSSLAIVISKLYFYLQKIIFLPPLYQLKHCDEQIIIVIEHFKFIIMVY